MNRSKFKQGKFKPSNPDKWDTSNGDIFYRSSWELIFMKWLDTNENIIRCSSESIIIPYRYDVDGRKHRYFPDFYAVVKDKSGGLKEYIFEIKPKDQCNPPKMTHADGRPKRKTKKLKESINTFIKNSNKWAATEKYCRLLQEKGRDINFQIITEVELGIHK